MEQPLVTCMCVTRRRVPLLGRAVACFRSQTHARRELVVVHDADDVATRDYVASLGDPSIRAVGAPAEPRPRLGGLRNLAVASSRGEYVAQWDDDDWYSPDRLAAQLQAVRESRQPACVLWRWTLFDMATGQAYVSARRPWEGSLFIERAAIPAYPDLPRFEDTPVIEQLAREGRVVGLDRPELYVYVYHGGNTWTRVHWKREILRGAQALGAAEGARIRGLMYAHLQPAAAAQS